MPIQKYSNFSVIVVFFVYQIRKGQYSPYGKVLPYTKLHIVRDLNPLNKSASMAPTMSDPPPRVVRSDI